MENTESIIRFKDILEDSELTLTSFDGKVITLVEKWTLPQNDYDRNVSAILETTSESVDNSIASETIENNINSYVKLSKTEQELDLHLLQLIEKDEFGFVFNISDYGSMIECLKKKKILYGQISGKTTSPIYTLLTFLLQIRDYRLNVVEKWIKKNAPFGHTNNIEDAENAKVLNELERKYSHNSQLFEHYRLGELMHVPPTIHLDSKINIPIIKIKNPPGRPREGIVVKQIEYLYFNVLKILEPDNISIAKAVRIVRKEIDDKFPENNWNEYKTAEKNFYSIKSEMETLSRIINSKNIQEDDAIEETWEEMKDIYPNSIWHESSVVKNFYEKSKQFQKVTK